MRLKAIWVVLVLWVAMATIANASPERLQVSNPTSQIFFVSGLLQKTVEKSTVKLVQLVLRYPTEEQATDAFFKMVSRDFPEYSVIDHLINAEAEVKTPDCKPLGTNI